MRTWASIASAAGSGAEERCLLHIGSSEANSRQSGQTPSTGWVQCPREQQCLLIADASLVFEVAGVGVALHTPKGVCATLQRLIPKFEKHRLQRLATLAPMDIYMTGFITI